MSTTESDAMDESWAVFIDQYGQFMKLQRELAKTEWYVNGGWTMFIGHYHAGIYAQIYKPHWYNQTGDGIHFETGVTAETLINKRTGIDLHIGHRNLFDRAKFNELTVARMADVVATWGDGYLFSDANLSQRVSVGVSFTKSNFAQQMAKAFTQLCTLGPIIDEGLAGLAAT